MKQINFLVLAVLLVSGCAAMPDYSLTRTLTRTLTQVPPPSQNVQLAENTPIYCVRDSKTGTSIPSVNCFQQRDGAERLRLIDDITNKMRGH